MNGERLTIRAGEKRANLGRLHAADTGQVHERRAERRVEVARHRAQIDVPPRAYGAQQDLVVLEVGGLQPDFHAVREREDGDADAVERPSRGDMAGGRLHRATARARDVDDFHGSTVAAAASASTWRSAASAGIGAAALSGAATRTARLSSASRSRATSLTSSSVIPGSSALRQVVFRLDAGKRFVRR